MSINAKLISILSLPGWTQTKVSERLGVSQSTVNRWTRGTAPEGDHRDKISDLYNEVHGLTGVFDLLPIRGKVAESQTIEWIDRADQMFAPQPPSVAKTLTVVTIESDTLLPYFPKNALLYYGDPTQPADGVGDIVVSELTDGRLIVRKIQRGSAEGLWTLTIPSASDMADIEVEQVYPIEWVKPYSWMPLPF